MRKRDDINQQCSRFDVDRQQLEFCQIPNDCHMKHILYVDVIMRIQLYS